jgi:hypothetical protein
VASSWWDREGNGRETNTYDVDSTWTQDDRVESRRRDEEVGRDVDPPHPAAAAAPPGGLRAHNEYTLILWIATQQWLIMHRSRLQHAAARHVCATANCLTSPPADKERPLRALVTFWNCNQLFRVIRSFTAVQAGIYSVHSLAIIGRTFFPSLARSAAPNLSFGRIKARSFPFLHTRLKSVSHECKPTWK